MAVLTEMYNVVIRVSTLTVYYPGGVAAYESVCPNRTFCSDGEVCRVGFMSWADTELFMQSLRRFDVSLIGFASEEEWFEYRLEHHPEFMRRIEEACIALRAGEGIPLRDLR